MRRSLTWGLAASGAASAIALWLEPQPGTSGVVVEARATTAPSVQADMSGAAPAPTLPPLPATLPDRDLEGGQHDLLTPVALPPPPPPPPPPPAAPPPPPPPPTAPPLTWRAVGAMTTPAGEHLAWLGNGGDEIVARPGVQLPDGYVVQAVERDAVVVSWPALGTVVRLALPREQAAGP